MDYIERMKEEAKELGTRLEKLYDFIERELRGETNLLNKRDCSLACVQYQFMQQYFEVLKTRIDIAEGNKK